MSKEIAVVMFGIWIVIVPYLGIPGSWKSMIYTAIGLLVMAVGLFLRAEALSRHEKRSGQHPFVENITASGPHEDVRHDRKEKLNSLN